MTNRREFFRNTALLGGAALFGTQFLNKAQAATVDIPSDRVYASILGWKIGPQIYSFKDFPFDVAIKKVRACGVDSFELFTGQQLSQEVNVPVGPALLKPENKNSLKIFKQLLAESGCTLHAMGVCPADRAHFDFAAYFGLTVINAEPGFDKIAEVSKLADEYLINVGLHNHPKPSIYWNPDIVMEHLKDASSRVGACCDTGHWLRSGLCPIESLQKLKGRIVSFHIKDLKKNEAGKLVDIPLGKGDVGIAEILKVSAAQHVHAPFSIEYESDWKSNQPLVAECVQFFDKTAKEIVLA